jgi:hypothetical protein
MLAGAGDRASPRVRSVAQAVAGLVDETSFGSLGMAAQLAADVTVLARASEVLAAETARRVAAADRFDVTATGIRSTLAEQGWSGKATWRSLKAGGFTDRHPTLLGLWRAGKTNADVICAIATGVRNLSQDDAAQVVDWLVPLLPQLNERQAAVAVAAAADRLQPKDAESRQKRAYDGRYLSSSTFRDQVLIEARLPALEGQAFLAAVAAFAEKLRVEGDQLTKGQRQADALAAMVAALAAEGKTPSLNGQPAATTVLLPLSEAERIAAGRPREPQSLPDLTGFSTTATGRTGAGDADQHDIGHSDAGQGDADRSHSDSDDPWTTTDHAECGRRPFSCLPMTPGVIAGQHTLGDAAARFLLCASELTGAIVTTGACPDPHPDRMVAALLGAAPLQPLALGRGQRFATTAQRRALELRDGGCVIPGCGIDPSHCQTHHEPGWTQGGRTDLNDLALLCWPHHRQADDERWRLTRNPDSAGPHWLVERGPRHRWRA